LKEEGGKEWARRPFHIYPCRKARVLLPGRNSGRRREEEGSPSQADLAIGKKGRGKSIQLGCLRSEEERGEGKEGRSAFGLDGSTPLFSLREAAVSCRRGRGNYFYPRNPSRSRLSCCVQKGKKKENQLEFVCAKKGQGKGKISFSTRK